MLAERTGDETLSGFEMPAVLPEHVGERRDGDEVVVDDVPADHVRAYLAVAGHGDAQRIGVEAVRHRRCGAVHDRPLGQVVRHREAEVGHAARALLVDLHARRDARHRRPGVFRGDAGAAQIRPHGHAKLGLDPAPDADIVERDLARRREEAGFQDVPERLPIGAEVGAHRRRGQPDLPSREPFAGGKLALQKVELHPERLIERELPDELRGEILAPPVAAPDAIGCFADVHCSSIGGRE